VLFRSCLAPAAGTTTPTATSGCSAAPSDSFPVKAAAPLDYRELARRRLPHFLFEYMDGGAFDEATLARNRADLAAIALRQRVLRDVAGLDVCTRLFGQSLDVPVVIGPIGLAGMNARRGEVHADRAAEAAGINYTPATVATCSLDEVRAAVTTPCWFQLYVIRDRGFLRDLLAEALAAGCTTLVFTVDMPVPGTRYRDYRAGLAGAPGMRGALRRVWQGALRPLWAWDVGIRGRPHSLGNVAPVLAGRTGIEDFFAWMCNNFDPAVNWDILDWIRDAWPGHL